MGDVPSPFPPSPPYHPSQKSNLPMLYYGLVVVGTAAFVLTVYNLIIIRWCSHRQGRTRQNGLFAGATTSASSASSQNIHSSFLSSFKYKKDTILGQDTDTEQECAVCLSVFEEGEDVRQLPSCKHSFHASCIDMWLYSHHDCPLCRTHVSRPPLCHPLPVPDASSETREGLLDSSSIV